jgi:adenylosuccinate synthase
VEGKEQNEMLFDNNTEIDPVYTELEGWHENISEIKDFSLLPENLIIYIDFIEKQTGIPITLVSVGPNRSSTIFRV